MKITIKAIGSSLEARLKRAQQIAEGNTPEAHSRALGYLEQSVEHAIRAINDLGVKVVRGDDSTS